MKALSLLSLVVAANLFCQSGAMAWPSRLTIDSGSGDEITIKKGLFGSKEKVVKDRLGDKYVQKKGLFGTKQTEINVLGNSYKTKKGLFGGSEIQVNSILGDSVKSKKHWWGRNTSVDASGVTNLLDQAFKGKMGNIKGIPGLNNQSQPGLNSQSQPGVDQLMQPAPQSIRSTRLPQPAVDQSLNTPVSQPQVKRSNTPLSADPINSTNDVLQLAEPPQSGRF